eukprot:5765604-Lingulodinium_polyedra.AAC.1
MDQSEKLLVFADMMSSIPDRPRMFYTGGNKGKCWTNIVMEPIDMAWQLPRAEKMTCLGQAVRPVGG